MPRRVFLDAGAGLSPNPSSRHAEGRGARAELNRARATVFESLFKKAEGRLVFTSSGTEANQLAVRSALRALGRGFEWLQSPWEHPSVTALHPLAREQGSRILELPLNGNGLADLDFARIRENSLVTLNWVSHETGVIQDARAFSEEAAKRGAWLHLDASQALGRVQTLEHRPRTLAASGSKISAKRVGFLWAAPDAPIEPLVLGDQEGGLRGGTEDVAAIAGLAAALAQRAGAGFSSDARSRDRLEAEVLARVPGARVNCARAPRVAQISSITITGLSRDVDLVAALDLEGFAVSSGPACKAGAREPSAGLLALGLSPIDALNTIRVSFNEPIGDDVIADFASALARVIDRQARPAA